MTSTELKHQARLQARAAACQSGSGTGKGGTSATRYYWEQELLLTANAAMESSKAPTVALAGLPSPKQQ